jgi:hypothetical protein
VGQPPVQAPATMMPCFDTTVDGTNNDQHRVLVIDTDKEEDQHASTTAITEPMLEQRGAAVREAPAPESPAVRRHFDMSHQSMEASSSSSSSATGAATPAPHVPESPGLLVLSPFTPGGSPGTALC